MQADRESEKQIKVFSWPRLGLIIVMAAGGVIGTGILFQSLYRIGAERERERLYAALFPLSSAQHERLATQFTDQDGDLIADPPRDASRAVRPDPLVFAPVAALESQQQAEKWQPLIDALRDATGSSVAFSSFQTVDDQIAALQSGKLHVTVVNTGAVPKAVNSAGFVPISTSAEDDGSYGYTMQFIVPNTSSIHSLQDVKGMRITFTRRDSNSGFKAPIVILLQDYGMRPGLDYDFGFSTSHEESILGIAKGHFAVAAVASDVLDDYVRDGSIDQASFRVVYESERFPPAALGYVFNLAPDVAKSVREVLLSSSHPMPKRKAKSSKASARFVAIRYKDDWSVIRRIDNSLNTVDKSQR